MVHKVGVPVSFVSIPDERFTDKAHTRLTEDAPEARKFTKQVVPFRSAFGGWLPKKCN